jgi:hypothetical protein
MDVAIQEHRLLRRRRVDFSDLVRLFAGSVGGIRRDECFMPLGVDGIFELYRWMAASVTGDAWDRWSWPTRWGRGSLVADLGGRPGCTSTHDVTPLRGSFVWYQDSRPPCGWRTELATRIGHALLDGGKMAEWREAMGIDLGKPRFVSMLVYDCPPPAQGARWSSLVDFGREVDSLFALATPTRRLRKQLNKYHPDARYLTAVLLAPASNGWIACTEYGVDGARWNGPEIAQGKDEPFVDFIRRAHKEIDSMLTPACQRKRAACEPEPQRPRWYLDQMYGGAECEARP